MPRHSIPAALPTFAEYRRQPDFGTSIDHDRDDWLIAPCQQDRDSDTLTRSNFAVMVSELERIEQDAQTEGAEYFDIFELHRFGHWGPGWIEIVLVRPGTAAAEYVAELADSLADYPVADESHFSQLESDEAAESWESWGASVFKRAIRAKFRDAAPFVVECIDDTATDEQLREWMEELYPNEPYYFDCGECNFPIDRAVSNCGRDELAAFAWKLRGDLRGE